MKRKPIRKIGQSGQMLANLACDNLMDMAE